MQKSKEAVGSYGSWVACLHALKSVSTCARTDFICVIYYTWGENEMWRGKWLQIGRA